MTQQKEVCKCGHDITEHNSNYGCNYSRFDIRPRCDCEHFRDLK